MDNEQERYTHFQGFAKLLWDEIEDEILVADHSMARHYHPLAPQVSKEMELLLAQRAYDLAMHVLEHASYGSHAFDAEIVFKHVPDLTEWPKTASQSPAPDE